MLHGVHDLRFDRVDIGSEVTESSGSQAKPSESTSIFASAGVGGAPCSRAPIDSPSSSPKAAM